MFIALLELVLNWKHPKEPSARKQILIHPYNRICTAISDEFLIFATMWMKLTDVMQTEEPPTVRNPGKTNIYGRRQIDGCPRWEGGWTSKGMKELFWGDGKVLYLD